MQVMKRILNVLVPLALVVAMALVILGSRSGLNGTWVKRSGDRTIPDEITIRAKGNQFRERWFDKGGISTILTQCDGAEHLWLSIDPIRITYHARLDGKTLVITKHMSGLRDAAGSITGGVFVKQWAVIQDGRELVVTGGHPETTFDRRPLLASLFSGTP